MWCQAALTWCLNCVLQSHPECRALLRACSVCRASWERKGSRGKMHLHCKFLLLYYLFRSYGHIVDNEHTKSKVHQTFFLFKYCFQGFMLTLATKPIAENTVTVNNKTWLTTKYPYPNQNCWFWCDSVVKSIYIKKDCLITIYLKKNLKSFAIQAFSDSLSSLLKGVLDTWSESKLTTVKYAYVKIKLRKTVTVFVGFVLEAAVGNNQCLLWKGQRNGFCRRVSMHSRFTDRLRVLPDSIVVVTDRNHMSTLYSYLSILTHMEDIIFSVDELKPPQCFGLDSLVS